MPSNFFTNVFVLEAIRKRPVLAKVNFVKEVDNVVDATATVAKMVAAVDVSSSKD